jgi:hypothetical protein
MGRHESGQPPVTDQQVQQQLAAERSKVDAYQTVVGAQQAVDTITTAINEELGTRPADLAASQGWQAAARVPANVAGGYKFSPAQIEDQLRQCADLMHGLQQEDLVHARKIAFAQPPAPDTVASVPQAQAVSALGHRLIQRIQNQIKFVSDWQSQLQQVRQNYLDQEGRTVADWKGLSGGLYT